jgi:uncharacterized protein
MTPFTKLRLLAGTIVAMVTIICCYFFLFNKRKIDLKVPVVTWNHLVEQPLNASSSPENIAKLHHKMIRIAGFIVPLDDATSTLSDFLLVPNAQACIHVPPPPPNQMILVHMTTPVEYTFARVPVWVQGTFSVSTEKHNYGSSLFSMAGTAIDNVIESDRADL